MARRRRSPMAPTGPYFVRLRVLISALSLGRSAATELQRKIADFFAKSLKIRKEIFYYISCFPCSTCQIFSFFFEPFFGHFEFFLHKYF